MNDGSRREIFEMAGAVFHELNGHNVVARANVSWEEIKDSLKGAKCQRCLATVGGQSDVPVLVLTLEDGRRFMTEDTSPKAQAYVKSRAN